MEDIRSSRIEPLSPDAKETPDEPPRRRALKPQAQERPIPPPPPVKTEEDDSHQLDEMA